MKKVIAVTPPIGPYSPALQLNNTLYISGQIAVEEARKGTIEDETKAVLQQISALLKTANFSLQDIVKCTVYLVDMKDFSAMNSIYETFFTTPAPTRTTIGVKDLPKHARIEIDAIAIKGDF